MSGFGGEMVVVIFVKNAVSCPLGLHGVVMGRVDIVRVGIVRVEC